MKILKRILITLVILIVIPLIIALFMSKDLKSKREITINVPNQVAFDYIKLLKNQDNFSVWAKMDPKMKKTYKGTDGTVGFISTWDSKNDDVGAGEQEITKIVEGSRVDFKLRFKRPMESENDAYMTTEKLSENSTKVSWGFSGKINWPFNFFCLFIDMEKQIGDDFSKGLENLKTELEKQ